MAPWWGRISIEVEPDSAIDAEDRELLARQLHQDLVDLAVGTVDLVCRRPPGAVRDAGRLTVDTLLVVPAGPEAGGRVLAAVGAWLAGRSVRVRLEAGGIAVELGRGGADADPDAARTAA